MLKKVPETALVFTLLCALSFCAAADLPEQATFFSGSPVFCRAAQAQAPLKIAFSEMYGSVSSLGIEFSDKLKNAAGQQVKMIGFMAPPLTPSINFFVLTREPMSICPFCSTDADWPSDIVVVKLEEPVTALPFDRPISVTGLLELGTAVDAETGFVSLVRIRAEELEEF